MWINAPSLDNYYKIVIYFVRYVMSVVNPPLTATTMKESRRDIPVIK
jgi:hypothetical protein